LQPLSTGAVLATTAYFRDARILGVLAVLAAVLVFTSHTAHAR